MKGIIKKLDERKFGFITVDGGTDYFFHSNECENFDGLKEGDSVTFDTADSDKGPKAVNVKLDSGSAPEEAAPAMEEAAHAMEEAAPEATDEA